MIFYTRLKFEYDQYKKVIFIALFFIKLKKF